MSAFTFRDPDGVVVELPGEDPHQEIQDYWQAKCKEKREQKMSYRVAFIDQTFDSESVEALLIGRVLDVMKGKDRTLKERLIETLKPLLVESDVRPLEIEALGISTRTYNALVGRGIKTIADLLDQVAEDGGYAAFQKNTRNLGGQSMKELRDILDQATGAALRGRNLNYLCYGPDCPNPNEIA